MGKHRRTTQVIIFAVILIVGALTLVNQVFFGEEKPVPGAKAPDFVLTGMDGNPVELSQFKGKAVVINFWGTFCEPCRLEMPAFQAQYDKWDKDKVVFLGINLGESKITAASFLQQYDITFPTLLDPDEEIRRRYNVMYYPTTFFVNADGTIHSKYERMMSEYEIDQAVAAIYDKQEISQ